MVPNSMNETIAFVTGANKGIGREISRQLAAKGILVLMGARDRDRGEKAMADLRGQGLPVEFVAIDVTSQPSVDEAAAEVTRRFGRVDILVNNAGIALDWFPGSQLTVEVLQQTFETNVFGVFRVTKAFLPLLKKSQHARIVNLSSGLGSLARNADPNSTLTARNMLLAYCSSKAALNMITVQLSNELKSAGFKVNSANPGFTATDMNQNRGPKTVEQGAATAVRLALMPDDGPTGGVFGDDGPEPGSAEMTNRFRARGITKQARMSLLFAPDGACESRKRVGARHADLFGGSPLNKKGPLLSRAQRPLNGVQKAFLISGLA